MIFDNSKHSTLNGSAWLMFFQRAKAYGCDVRINPLSYTRNLAEAPLPYNIKQCQLYQLHLR